MANFTLSQNRGTIENYSAQIEREEFMKTLQIDPSKIIFKIYSKKLTKSNFYYCFVFITTSLIVII